MNAAGSVTFAVTHRTTYTYDANVVAGYNVAHLVPRSFPGQSCVRSVVTVSPEPDDVTEREDYFGNRVTWFSLHRPHRRLEIIATSEVVREVSPPGFFPAGVADGGGAWEDAVERLRSESDPEHLAAREFALESPRIPHIEALHDYARESFDPGRPVLDAALDLCRRIHLDYAYVPGATTTSTRLDQVMRERRGVCQDFAHLGIGALRSMGVPARYVSGYLETQAPAGQEKLLGVDASHAWLAAFMPGVGWVDLDPTNDKIPDERYVTTAWGRDYADVPPLKGVVFSSATMHELAVAVDVMRVP